MTKPPPQEAYGLYFSMDGTGFVRYPDPLFSLAEAEHISMMAEHYMEAREFVLVDLMTNELVLFSANVYGRHPFTASLRRH